MKLLQRLFVGDVPLIADGAFRALHARLLHEPQGAEHPYIAQMREQMKPKMTLVNGVAVIPVAGILAKSPDVWELFNGVEDSNSVLQMVQSAASHPEISGVLLQVESPGGFMTSADVADAVKLCDRSKPVVTHTSGMMASLGYYIGCQASMVVASRTAMVGSIGVYATHVDYSKMYEDAGIKVEVFKNKEGIFKAAGVMGTALTDEQRTQIAEGVQRSFKDFSGAVKAKRPGVKEETMQGQVFYGAEAKAAGLVDAVGDSGYAMSLLRLEMRKRSGG